MEGIPTQLAPLEKINLVVINVLYIDLAVGGVSEVNQSDRRRSLPDLRNETQTSRDSFTLKVATATLAGTSGNVH